MKLGEVIKQKSYEKIVFIIREHWLTYVPTAIMMLILAMLPVALYYVTITTNPTFFDDLYQRTFLILVLSMYELSIALFFYSSFLMYYLNMLIVTNDRLIEIKQNNLFSRLVSEMDLYKIQDSSSEINGIIPTIFDYGKLTIETAGELSNFTFTAVPRVNEVRRRLIQLAEDDRKYHNSTEAHQI
ncbi:MAG: hypothetical protein NT003_04630 [Candidatus Magasanikbacteria bacterium]|nr:hypothetical protein [Candidatus Magasanikbacteria bacterium]